MTTWFAGLAAVCALMVVGWLVSVWRKDVSHVDVLWGPAIATAGTTWLLLAASPGPRSTLAVALAWAWALRLAAYVLVRNLGKGEDRRYQEIRARNEPGFWWKSAYLVFLLQAVLACVVGLPLFGTAQTATPLGVLDALGAMLAVAGLVIETVADWQLRAFLRTPAAGRGVLDRGLWRYSRHPNYFGDCCLWWGLGLLGVAAGAWWTLLGPALLTFLLLRVSGVALTEKDIAGRRPDYQAYIRRTSAFVPWPPRD
jgi:steroid 5-alpha reductase family enzyme